MNPTPFSARAAIPILRRDRLAIDVRIEDDPLGTDGAVRARPERSLTAVEHDHGRVADDPSAGACQLEGRADIDTDGQPARVVAEQVVDAAPVPVRQELWLDVDAARPAAAVRDRYVRDEEV